MHGGTDRVFRQRGFERLVRLLDEAWHLEVGRDDALGRELLQGLETAAAGDDRVHVVRVERGGVNDEILLETAGPNAGLELGLFGRRRRRLAHVGGGQHELVEGDGADGGCAGHGWGLLRRADGAISRPVNPSHLPSPLSLFPCRADRRRIRRNPLSAHGAVSPRGRVPRI